MGAISVFIICAVVLFKEEICDFLRGIVNGD
jgi:hypothetical protein